MSSFNVTKLDRRHSAFPFMRYYAIPHYSYKEARIERFIELRNWCWDTFGPGVERKYIILHPTQDTLESINAWCWHTEQDQLRIYFKSDKELAVFKLKWQ